MHALLVYTGVTSANKLGQCEIGGSLRFARNHNDHTALSRSERDFWGETDDPAANTK